MAAPILDRFHRAASRLRPGALAARLRAQLTAVEQIETLTATVRSLETQLEAVRRGEAQLRAIVQADNVAAERVQAFYAMMRDHPLEPHVRKAIARAELHLDPFPYCIVDGIFPRPYYAALREAIPPLPFFADRAVNKQQLLVPFALAPRYCSAVWAHMADVAAPTVLVPAVVEKFRAPLTEWLRRSFSGLGDDPLRAFEMKSSDGRIMLRRPGYRILPHRDPKWGFLTCLLYLARPGDDARWGTQIFRVEGDEDARGGSPHWIPVERCALVTDVEFLPNRMLIFLNSAGAHGAHIPADAEPADLERYTYQVRVGPDRESIETARATLTEEQQALWARKTLAY